MTSTCPNCKRQIEHEDFLFEVQCECGMRFNPFYDSGAEASHTDHSDPGTGGGNAESFDSGSSVPDNTEGFAESRNAFEDIVRFGEGNEEPAAKSEASAAGLSVNTAPTGSSVRQFASATPADLGETILVAADSLEGFRLEQYFPPISAWATLSDGEESPLSAGYGALWQQCQRLGGNAIISVRWALMPDGTRCLITGVPVRCAPNTP